MSRNELAIGGIFRWAGTFALVSAGIAFLVEGWTDPRLLPRQLAWAGITLALVMSGVLSARRFRDPLGARVCLGLAAATIPLHFAQLGSALFELHRDGVVAPHSVLLSGGIVLLLLPVLAVGGAALVRRWVLPFTVLLFALGCPLLLSTRAGDAIAWLGLGELALLVGLELTVLARRTDLDGMEGGAVRALLCLPMFILLGRNALHEVTPLWLSMLLATPGTLLLIGSRWLSEKRGFRDAAELSGGALLAAAGLLASTGWVAGPVCVATGLLAALVLSRNTPRRQWVGWCGATALGVAAATGFGGSSTLATSLGIAVSLGYVTLAYYRRSLAWCAVSSCCTLGLGASLLVSLISVPVYFGWLLPAVLGLLLLVLGSSVQSPHSRGGRLWVSLSEHFLDKSLTSARG
ncbi:MAG: hypothetical protein ABIQ16_07230 [Polyangiaceae bacterium]